MRVVLLAFLIVSDVPFVAKERGSIVVCWMRWLGACVVSLELCRSYVGQREMVGTYIGSVPLYVLVPIWPNDTELLNVIVTASTTAVITRARVGGSNCSEQPRESESRFPSPIFLLR